MKKKKKEKEKRKKDKKKERIKSGRNLVNGGARARTT